MYCIEACSCLDCFNKPIHESVVLETRRQIESRNPLAFAPKVILNSDSVSELGVRLYALNVCHWCVLQFDLDKLCCRRIRTRRQLRLDINEDATVRNQIA